jgi:hypothetical protein
VLPQLHGAMMFVAFAVLMSFGVFVSRFLKDYYWWFPLHWLLQTFAVVLALAAFVIILVATDDHFSNVHSWFGFSALALAFTSPFLGWAADLVYDPGRSSVPLWPDLLHRTTGRLALIVAYVAIYLGIVEIGGSLALRLTFLVLPVTYVIIYAALEVYRYRNSHEDK